MLINSSIIALLICINFPNGLMTIPSISFQSITNLRIESIDWLIWTFQQEPLCISSVEVNTPSHSIPLASLTVSILSLTS